MALNSIKKYLSNSLLKFGGFNILIFVDLLPRGIHLEGSELNIVMIQQIDDEKTSINTFESNYVEWNIQLNDNGWKSQVSMYRRLNNFGGTVFVTTCDCSSTPNGKITIRHAFIQNNSSFQDEMKGPMPH